MYQTLNDYYKFKYSVVIAKSKTPWRIQTGVFGDGWNHHFQHKLQSMGEEITNHALRRNVTLSILKNISKRTFDTTNKVIVHFNML
jgi:hypothetical protein